MRCLILAENEYEFSPLSKQVIPLSFNSIPYFPRCTAIKLNLKSKSCASRLLNLKAVEPRYTDVPSLITDSRVRV